MLTLTVLLYSVCTGLNAFAGSFATFCLYRFLTGLGVGGVFGLAVALVADAVPDRARAPALGLLQSLSTWGNLVAGLLGMGIGLVAARQLLPFGLKPWQALFLIGIVPAALCVLIMRRLPEPEKWVQAKAKGAATGIKFGSYASLLGDPRWSRNAWLGLVVCGAGIVGLSGASGIFIRRSSGPSSKPTWLRSIWPRPRWRAGRRIGFPSGSSCRISAPLPG